MKCVFFVADNYGVSRVVSAVELHYVVDLFGQKVGGFTLALIAPLGANKHDCRHGRAFLKLGMVRECVPKQV